MGDSGETVVLNLERNKLRACGRDDLAQLVVHEEALGCATDRS